ncbi:MAG: 3-deoxy-manno-octulosonate cytidylyltransferase [Zetaproteobacteria bacterium CG_4_9_14_3_um_filter_49_83]|nr:MAG: 3-deoxy-manno-octulosonate cytidylyltransferase [Zetaproteobacteria bacterium CG1_02_49_23]PIQ30417.1 MAG: 3-deoxy-manno-octulosonate cytidylyltransferase [Zetaproteobacteria bacterium CG17_big_fil_post_rev_8_21_14_2_50_50_13]PIV29975.1 MAG: 3-deoxy-manno-octulosonate cytidylyltransferase [Zetaproteobacteria bacterium CG02_land_8_20_14_3_00_50_9]PIY56519.1 MAG: 3-deoxy-manno-octulosonate cytidylyltransferase [Zetaproteobacteria bacterium CG_4_10_14_0_8_um_filter_49_80]PJA35249.1 MAG: 3-
MKIAIGIPARFASTRFPGKPLADIAGKPMLGHVIERALSTELGPVIVATDDKRIAEVARYFGASVSMTSAGHGSGTERLAEAMLDVDCDIVINVQGDEPLIDPDAIRSVILPFEKNPALPMATLAHPIRHKDDLTDPNVVKVVCNHQQLAMYFSRAAIPYPRQSIAAPVLQHVGLYAYSQEFLQTYPTLTACDIEQSEQLEQLRVLYHGYNIAVTVGDFHCIGVDTPDDLQKAEALLRQNLGN